MTHWMWRPSSEIGQSLHDAMTSAAAAEEEEEERLVFQEIKNQDWFNKHR